MALFELVVGLLLGAAVLTTFAQRVGVPFPVLLAVAGTASALIPGETISARLDPDLALALFVAPVLLDAGFNTSLPGLRDNWRPISNLVIAAVGLTDAVAATTVLRQLSPPYRMLVILEGESLLNDATAL